MDLRARAVLQAERVAALAQADVERRRARRSGRRHGSARGWRAWSRERSSARWCHGSSPAASGAVARRYQRSTASTRASTSAVVRARTIAPSAPAACQRSHAARGSRTHADSAMSASPSQSPWKPTRTRWSSRRRPPLERLEIERQVLLEVVVEGRPAVADPAGQPGPGRRLAADDDRRRGRRDRERDGVLERVVRRGPRHRPAGPQGADDGDRLLEPGDALRRLRKLDPVGRVLLRMRRRCRSRG